MPYPDTYRRNSWITHFLNPCTKLILSSSNPYFYSILYKNITDKFTTIRDPCKFLQSNLVSYMRFEVKLGHTQLNSERIFIYVVDLIPNDWKHNIRKETSQKLLFKIFCFINKATKKKLSNKEICFTFRSNNNFKFKFISWPNFIEGYHNLSPGI